MGKVLDIKKINKSLGKESVDNKEEPIQEAKADVSKIIKDLSGSFAGSNEEQMKAVQLLKGLATSDDPKSNEFMKALDTATTSISKKMSGDKKEESIQEATQDRVITNGDELYMIFSELKNRRDLTYKFNDAVAVPIRIIDIKETSGGVKILTSRGPYTISVKDGAVMYNTEMYGVGFNYGDNRIYFETGSPLNESTQKTDSEKESVSEATVIDLSVPIEKIGNFRDLSNNAQRIIVDSENIQSEGFQSINGYDGRKVLWNASGYWDKDLFYIESMYDRSGLIWKE